MGCRQRHCGHVRAPCLRPGPRLGVDDDVWLYERSTARNAAAAHMESGMFCRFSADGLPLRHDSTDINALVADDARLASAGPGELPPTRTAHLTWRLGG